MAGKPDAPVRRDVDLDEEAARKAREASPERSVLESYSGREERGGFLGETPPSPLDGTDDTVASAVPGETVDGLDEMEEEVRRQAEDRVG